MNLYILNQIRRGTDYGVGTYIRELTATLKYSKINVCVVHLMSEKHQIKSEEKDGIKHWYFPSVIPENRTKSNEEKWELYYRNIVYLLQLHIQDKKNLVFQFNFLENGKLSHFLKKVFDCRTLAVNHFTEWGFIIYDNLPRLRNILNNEFEDNVGEILRKSFEEERSYFSKVDHVICLSNYMKEIFCRDYGLNSTKVSVIPNGLFDTTIPANNKTLIRKKWNVQIDEKIILFVGRIDEIKGVFFLIKAFAKVLEKFQNCRLIIAGSGNYDSCFKEAKSFNTKVTLTGFLDKPDLDELYQIADIGIIPSLFEPFGYVAVEMMMHKLPIIATITSGLNEVVDSLCGLKIPLILSSNSVEIDIALLSDNILYLLHHPIEAKQMGENGRKRFLKEYTSDKFLENMTKVYKHICQ